MRTKIKLRPAVFTPKRERMHPDVREDGKLMLEHLATRWRGFKTMHLGTWGCSRQPFAGLAPVCPNIHHDAGDHAAHMKNFQSVLNPVISIDQAVLALFAQLHPGGSQ